MFFKENWDNETAPGWLVRDMEGWYRSLAKLKNIAAIENAKVVFGHDPDVFAQYAGKVGDGPKKLDSMISSGSA